MPASRTYNAAHIGGCRSGGGEHRSRDGGAGAKRKDISPRKLPIPGRLLSRMDKFEISANGQWSASILPARSVERGTAAESGGGGEIGGRAPSPPPAFGRSPPPSPDGED